MGDEFEKPAEVVTPEPVVEAKEGTQEPPAATIDGQDTPATDQSDSGADSAKDDAGDKPGEAPEDSEIDGIEAFTARFAKDPPKETREPANEADARIQEVIKERDSYKAENDRLRAGKAEPIIEGLEDFPDEIQEALSRALLKIEARNEDRFKSLDEEKTQKQMEREYSEARGIIGAERFDDPKYQGQIQKLLDPLQNSNGSMTPMLAMVDAAHKTLSGDEYRRGFAAAKKQLTHQAMSSTDGATSPAPGAQRKNSISKADVDF